MIPKINKKIKQEIKEILTRKQYPEFVIEGGLERSLQEWKNFVRWCEKGYDFRIEEYRNDLDKRNIIRIILEELNNKNFVDEILSFLKPIDNKFKLLLVETDKCIWGPRLANRYLPKEKYFWYWGIVNNAKGELLENLKESEFTFYKKKDKEVKS